MQCDIMATPSGVEQETLIYFRTRMSYLQTHYHIVVGTKHRACTLTHDYCEELYRYIWGIVKAKNSVLYQINGVEDHIHLFTSLHQSFALADFVKDIKVASSIWLKSHGQFPAFIGWAEGYGAFTHSHEEKKRLVAYIRNQKEHDKTVTFQEECKLLFEEQGLEFDERFLM
ncbi:MAG: IS200/IS605 family transposase [Flavobacteriales bacterium]